MIIQQLLAEAGTGGLNQGLVSVDADGAEAPTDWNELRSPENFVGYQRTQDFASPGGPVPDERRLYAVGSQIQRVSFRIPPDCRRPYMLLSR